MRMVVLGSTGFIGREVVRQLQNTRHHVFSLSRKDADMGDYAAFARSLGQAAPDAIINCAAHTGSGQYINEHQADVFSENTQMALNLYRAVRAHAPRTRIVHIFSNCSYPGDLGFQREEEWLSGPVHESIFAYGNAKRALFYTAWCYAKQYSIQSVNFISPEVYGPGDRTDPMRTHATNGMIIRLIQAKRRGDLFFEVWGTGRPVRETVYVSDVARVLVGGALLPAKRFPLVLNVGQNRGRTIAQTARAIARAVGFSGKIVFNPRYQDGAPKKVLSASHFKKVFTRFHFTDFEKGLRAAVKYYESVL